MPVALITGGGSLICEGIAQTLTTRGWDVIVSDIDEDRARLVVSVCNGPGRAEACLLDARDPEAVDTVVKRALDKHGKIDGLVNGAGGGRGIGFPLTAFADMTRDFWTRMLDANLNSALTVTHAVLPVMIKQRSGSIVSIAAGRGLKGGPKASIYSAAKGAIIIFSQSVAQEVGQYGVRINTIAPGNAEARWKKKSPEDARSPLGRATNAQDVGKGVAFLLSDEASHITGSCLDLSGGTSLH